MLHCLIKLSDTLKLKHSLVHPAVSVQVPTTTKRSSQCGWRPRLSLGRQPIRTTCIYYLPVLQQLIMLCEGGIFRLYIRFDECYNDRPPKVYFQSIPFHPNGECEMWLHFSGCVCGIFDDVLCLAVCSLIIGPWHITVNTIF